MIIFPTTPQEVQANRVRFIEALVNEDQGAQCHGVLFLRDCKEPKQKRCALGVAAKLFLGLNTSEEYSAYGGNITYDDLADMLGLDDCGVVWRLNDDEELPFAEIGAKLREEWDLSE